jgi:hypothetical protein
MKKLLSLIIAVLLITTVIVSLNRLPGKENKTATMPGVQNPDPEEFLVGAYSIGCASSNRLQELGLNIWHRFLNQETLTVSS